MGDVEVSGFNLNNKGTGEGEGLSNQIDGVLQSGSEIAILEWMRDFSKNAGRIDSATEKLILDTFKAADYHPSNRSDIDTFFDSEEDQNAFGVEVRARCAVEHILGDIYGYQEIDTALVETLISKYHRNATNIDGGVERKPENELLTL